MALDPEILITESISRADTYLNKADSAIQDIKNYSRYTQYGYVPTPNISGFQYPDYVAPKKDTTPSPVYEPPRAPLPTAPQLADVATIPKPTFPNAPTISTAGLFNEVMPSTNIPDWNNAEPDMHIDALVAEMDALAMPVLLDLDFPDITPLVIGPAPSLTLPAYDPPLAPDVLRDPVDYAALVESKYQTMLPQMQAYIDDKVAGWVSLFAPEYEVQRGLLADRLNAVLSSGQVLPDQFEAALYTRARGRVEQEFAAIEAGLSDNYSKRGFFAPPGAVTAGLHAGRLKGADALANQATDIYIKRREVEVQHLQFVLQLTSSQLQSVRGLAIQYAGVIANSIQQALSYSTQIGEMAIKLYDHLIARSQLIISVMTALNAQYETKLKAALSALDGYRLQLEAEKAKKDVELAQVQIIEAELKAQELQITRFKAMIEAISSKANIEELKLKGYQTRADVFKTQIQAQVAGFDIYKAALSGDQAKLEGELAKLKIYESQLSAINMELEANIKSTESTIASNDAKIKMFQSSGDVYKLDAQQAIQKFTALAEVKKLAQSLYGTELQGSVQIYQALIEQPKLMIDAVLRTYEGAIRGFETTGRLNSAELNRVQTAAEALASGFSNIASSALGAINSTVSSVKSA
jgi:hypothetical protein